nr:hypothetical protein [Helicobacter pylori]
MFLACNVPLYFGVLWLVGSLVLALSLVCALFFCACIACVISLSLLKLVAVSFFCFILFPFCILNAPL